MNVRLSLFVIVLLLFSTTFAQYSPDGNTVLLMHFDGNLSDASATGATAEAVGTVSFSEEAMYSQSVYLDNSGIFPDYATLLELYGNDTDKADSAYYADAVASDTSYIMVMPNAALDLSGDWTMEAWVMNVDNQAWSNGGWVLGKTNPDGYINYAVGNAPGNFTGAFTEDNRGYVSWEGSAISMPTYTVSGVRAEPVDSTENPKEYRYGWLHFTFIHDATNKWITMATHDAEGNLISCNYNKILWSDMNKTIEYQFHPGDGMPVVGVGDTLYIGFSGSKSVHGYIDELRISNMVRDDIIADPEIGSRTYNLNTGAEQGESIWNPYDTAPSYPIYCEFYTPGLEAITAKIHYHTRMYPLDERVAMDDEGWMTVDMTQQEGALYMGEIPQQPYKTVVEYYLTAETAGGATDTVGINHDWFHQYYGGSTWFYDRGFENTYMRFIVVQENQLTFEMEFEDFQPDNAPLETSDWGIFVETRGLVTYPDDVPLEDVAGESFASLYVQGGIVEGFIEMRDVDHLNSTSYTYTHWVKVDTFLHEGFFFAHQNGSRWSHQQEGFFEDAGDPPENYSAHGWWMNNPASVEYADPRFVHYSYMAGDYTHPYWQQESLYGPEGGWETDKWYKLVGASDYTGNPSADSAYLQVTDEDQNLLGRIGYPLRVPPSYQEGWVALGTRGDTKNNRIRGKIDHMKHWNYYRSPEEDPDLWYYVTAIKDDELGGGMVPFKFALQQNYPNPFNPITEIKFSIPSQQEVDLSVFDILGRRVKTLVSRKLPAGEYNITWDGTDNAGNLLSTGMYFYKLKGEKDSKTNKMLLLK